jgi:hypothetical protein
VAPEPDRDEVSAIRAAPGVFILASTLLVAGCRTVRPEPRDVPALTVAPTDASRAALAAAVTAALHGAQVTLADDALTRSSTLIVERARQRDAVGLPVDGRVVAAPERFRLVKRGGACVLVHERTGREAVLESTTCVASGG